MVERWHCRPRHASTRHHPSHPRRRQTRGRTGVDLRALTTIYSGPIRSEFASVRVCIGPRAMIILSKLADYSVIVATHLATDPDRQLTAAALADGTLLPRATVAKILKALAHAGLVKATRGPAGGYRLARRANAISVAEVVAAIDGDIGLTQCSVHVAECTRTNYCPTRPHWAAINRAVEQALMAVTLEAMITPRGLYPAPAGRFHPRRHQLTSTEKPHDCFDRYHRRRPRAVARGLQIRLCHRHRSRRGAARPQRGDGALSSRPKRASPRGCSNGGSPRSAPGKR